jgi:hypothetical protein
VAEEFYSSPVQHKSVLRSLYGSVR